MPACSSLHQVAVHEKGLPRRQIGPRRHPEGRHDGDVGRLRPVRHRRDPVGRDPRLRREEPDGGVQQRRRRRHRAFPPARNPADQEDDLVLCRREQIVRPAIPRRRTGTRIQSAGHPGRAHPRRRRRHSGVLHQDRRRHPDRRRQGSEGIRRREVPDGARAVRRSRHRPRLDGRYRRQSGLPQDRAELQPDDGDGGEDHGRRGRASGAGGPDQPRSHPYARHLRQAHHPGRHRQQAHRVPQHAQARHAAAATGEEV